MTDNGDLVGKIAGMAWIKLDILGVGPGLYKSNVHAPTLAGRPPASSREHPARIRWLVNGRKAVKPSQYSRLIPGFSRRAIPDEIRGGQKNGLRRERFV